MSKIATHWVYSSMTSDVIYGPFDPSENDQPTRTNTVLIRGGAGIANDRVVTPLGVCTPVDDNDMDILHADPVFKMHMKNGFIAIETSKEDADYVSENSLDQGDKSKPLTAADFAGENDVTPVIGGDVDVPPPPPMMPPKKGGK